MSFRKRTTRGVAVVVLVGMLASILLATVASFYASSAPDGLERVARDTGFDDQAQESATADSPIADYAFSGVEDERISVALAGLIGVAITGVIGFGLFAALKPRSDAP